MLQMGTSRQSTFVDNELADLAFQAQAVLPARRQRSRKSIGTNIDGLAQSFLSACVRLRLELPTALPISVPAAPAQAPVSREVELWLRQFVRDLVREELAERAPVTEHATTEVRQILADIMRRAIDGPEGQSKAAAPLDRVIAVDIVGLPHAERKDVIAALRKKEPVRLRFIEPKLAPRWLSGNLIVVGDLPISLANLAKHAVAYVSGHGAPAVRLKEIRAALDELALVPATAKHG
jgi:hypothetical protein